MEDFVAKLIKKSDLSVLTTKAVRKAYESHIKKTLSPDAKSRLKVFVNGILDKLAREMRESSPRKSPRKGTVINLSPKKVSEIVESALSPKKLSEDRITRSSPRKSSESRKARSPSPLEPEPRFSRKSAKKVETYTEVDQDSDDDEGDKLSRSKKTGKNVKAENAGDSSSEYDKGSDSDASNNSDESEEPKSRLATPKSVSKTKSPGKKVQTKETKESDDEQMEDLSENETTVSPTKRNTRHSVSPKKFKKNLPTRSPGKPTPRGKKRKSLNVNDALEAVMNSPKAEESENGANSPDSDSESEEEMVVKKKGQKRKLFTSDEDDGKKTTPMKGKKKSMPRKPLSKKQKVSDDEKSSEEKDSDVDEHVSSKKTKKVQSDEESADEPAQQEVKKKISSSKKPLSSRHKVLNDVESDDSEDDRLHIDVGVSNRTRKGREILQGSKRRERRGGKVTNYAESDSEMESLSSKAESKSDKIESDGASVDSGVNVDLRASSEKGKKGKEFDKKTKEKNGNKRNEDSEEEHQDSNQVDDVSEQDLSGAEEDVDKSVKKYGKKSGKRKSSSARNVKRKSYKESDDDSDDEDETITKDRSIFSLSETESDKNTKRRELRKALQQRHIAKILENESFDVKQCTIVLERIDDQIDWVSKTSKFKVPSRKVSARDSNHLDFTESEDNSVSSKEDRRKKTKLSKLPKSSTPVTKNLQTEILKTIKLLETDDSDSDDASLASLRTKEKKQTRGLNSTFNSEDMPLKSLRKRGKGKDRSGDSDEDEPDSPLAKSSKSTRSASRRRALDSTFDSDDHPLKSVGKKGRGKTLDTDEDEEDEHDSPLVKSKSKSASRRRALDSTFDSDDLPLKPVGKKGKGEGKYVYVDEEEEPFPSEDSDKPIFKSKSKNPVEPDVDYQSEQSGSNSENDSSDESGIAYLPTRTSPRKLETSLDLTPSQATRSHSVSPSKSKKSDIISESESGSDVGSLNDSIRSLEMLKGAKEKSPKSSIETPKRKKKLTKRRSNVPRGDNSDSDGSRYEKSPRKSAARGRHKSGSDSDVSSIIEAQDSSMVSAVNGNNNNSESDTGSVGPTNQNGSVVERSSPRKESKDESSDSGDSDVESKPDESRKSKSVDGVESDDTGLSVEAVKSPLKKGKKRGGKTADKKSVDGVESDDTGLSVEAVKSPLKKGKKRGKKTADKKSVDVVESDDTGLSVEAVKTPLKKGKKGKNTADKSSDSGDSDVESKPDESRKSKSVDGVESDDTGLSVEAVKSPLKKGKKRRKKTADKKSADVVESDDTGLSVEAVKTPLKKGKKGKNTADKENGTVTLSNLRKICRCAGIILRNTIELVGCDTDEKKRSKICEILREKGMKGQPTMSKAETLKLKKEASELDTDNIISDTGRPKRRKVQSRYRRGGDSRSPSPKKKLTPLKQKLSGLRGIIDSEGSASD